MQFRLTSVSCIGINKALLQWEIEMGPGPTDSPSSSGTLSDSHSTEGGTSLRRVLGQRVYAAHGLAEDSSVSG